MDILEIDHLAGTMIVRWNIENTILNHFIPEQLRENPEMSAQELEALLELERPVVEPPVYSHAEDVPLVLRDMVYRDYEIEVRTERDELLALSDWTQMADSPLTAVQKEAWAQYRQMLRDMPQQAGFPWAENTPPWPKTPLSSGA